MDQPFLVSPDVRSGDNLANRDVEQPALLDEHDFAARDLAGDYVDSRVAFALGGDHLRALVEHVRHEDQDLPARDLQRTLAGLVERIDDGRLEQRDVFPAIFDRLRIELGGHLIGLLAVLRFGLDVGMPITHDDYADWFRHDTSSREGISLPNGYHRFELQAMNLMISWVSVNVLASRLGTLGVRAQRTLRPALQARTSYSFVQSRSSSLASQLHCREPHLD